MCHAKWALVRRGPFASWLGDAFGPPQIIVVEGCRRARTTAIALPARGIANASKFHNLTDHEPTGRHHPA